MKKFFFSILAVGALVACTKSEVKYNDASEIAFAPVASTATKAAINSTAFPKDKDFNVWAYYGKDDASVAPNYGGFTTNYFLDALFVRKDNVNWGGDTPYYWPNNGSLVFAGYAAPMALQPTYTLSNDELKITSYEQPEPTSDYSELLWFGRTASYNNKKTGANVPVIFQHALSWITIQVKGIGMTANPANDWKIKSVVIDDVYKKGDVSCVGKLATWTNRDKNEDLNVYSSEGTLLNNAVQVLENVERGTLVLPQVPTTVTITYTCKTPAGETIEEVVSASLKYDNDAEWQNGKHYIYTITFSATEILIAPTVEDWVPVEVTTPAN